MSIYWEEEKDPSDVDFYEVTVNATWIGTETIQSATFVPDPASGITVGNLAWQGNAVRAQLSGGNLGTWGIEVTITTSDARVRQRTVYLVVREK